MTGRADPGQRAAIRELRARRASMHLSQKDLARVSGVPLRTLQRLEGEKGWSRPETLYELEKALGWLPGYMEERAARYNEDAVERANGPEAAALREVIRKFSAASEALDHLGDESSGTALPGA